MISTRTRTTLAGVGYGHGGKLSPLSEEDGCRKDVPRAHWARACYWKWVETELQTNLTQRYGARAAGHARGSPHG
jgi:hypothetical protein